MADPNVIRVPITKGGKGAVVEVNIGPEGDVPDAVLAEVYLQGLKVLLNRGMSKIATKGLEGEKLAQAQEAAMKVAVANLEKVRKGELRATRAKADGKVPGEVMTEARKLAKAMIKAGMKEAGIKVSHVEPKEITKQANELLADEEVGPEIIAQATEAVKARKEKEETIKVKLKALGAKVPVNAERKAKAEAKSKAAKADGLSAKQAGIALRAKPGTGQPSLRH